MILTYSEARDEIFGLVNDTWCAHTGAIFGGSRELRFPDVEHRDIPAQGKAWGYCEMLITDTRQIGLRNDATRRYETTGVLTLDVYVPRSEIGSAESALRMGHTVRRVLEQPNNLSGIWYRHVTARTARQTAGAVVVRVVADFNYTEEGESDG